MIIRDIEKPVIEEHPLAAVESVTPTSASGTNVERTLNHLVENSVKKSDTIVVGGVEVNPTPAAQSLAETPEAAGDDSRPPLIAYNPLTGETVNEGATTEDMFIFREGIKLAKGEIADQQRNVEAAIVSRMRRDNATIVDGEIGKGSLTEQREYQYDAHILFTQLKPLLSEDDWNAVCEMVPNFKHGKLKNLMKLGGDVAKIIQSAQHEVPKPPKLEFKVKPRQQ